MQTDVESSPPGARSTRLRRILRAVGPWLRPFEALTWALLFVVAGLFIALRYWVLPDIERYRPEIVNVISGAIGMPVRIGAVSASWEGLRPQVDLTDLRIYDHDGREVLALPSVQNIVAWRSLARGELRLHALTIDGPRLAIRRSKAGTLFVAGMRLDPDTGEGKFADWVLGQREIVVRNAEIEWQDELRDAPLLALRALNFRLRNEGEEHSIGLTAHPPAELGSTLDVRAELFGESAMRPSAWNGQVYAELGYTNLAGWRAWIDYPAEVRSGEGALRVWVTLGEGKLQRATVDLALSNVSARLASDLPQLELASLHGRLQGRRSGRGYELSGSELALTPVQGTPLRPASFHLSYEPAMGGELERGALSARRVELEPLAQLAEFLPFPAEPRNVLAELAPKGTLLEVKFDWSGPLGGDPQFIGRARFEALAMQARGKLPGFSGLSGALEATTGRGKLSLNSRAAALELPTVFPKPRVELDSLEGQLEWQRGSGNALKLRLAALSFANTALAGGASGEYQSAAEGPGVIDLTARLTRADASAIGEYLPLESIMGAATRRWLASAIIAGQGSDVRLRLKGDLRNFPFVNPATGDFEVAANVSGGVLEYAQGWPRIEGIEGALRFEREKMEITAQGGTILGTRLAQVRAGIADLQAPQGPVLAVRGEAEGPTQAFLDYIARTPVRGMTRGFTDDMSAGGRARLNLKLDLPIDDLDQSKVAGEVLLVQNSVRTQPQLPQLEQVTGRITFDDSSLTLHEVKAQLLGGTVTLSGGSRAESGVNVVARGDASVEGLLTLVDHPWARRLSGAAPYVVRIRSRGTLTQVAFESSLRGMASTLPSPLVKAANEALPLRVEFLPSEGGARDRVSVSLGRVLDAEFLRQREGPEMVVQRAAVALSPAPGQAMRLPERPGTLVYGSLPALDLDRWLPLVEGEGAASPATRFELKIAVLDAFGKRLRDVSLRAGADKVGWSASLEAQELAGDLSYRPEDGGKLIARMARFRIPDDTPGPRLAAHTERDLPAVDLIAERFSVRGKQLGRVEILAQRDGADWRIDKLALLNPEATMTGKGLWRTGAASRTQLDFELQASDVGNFLGRVGYADLVKGGKAQLGGTIAWNADPVSLDYRTLAGKLALNAEDGQFVEIEPGLGKLVSLMSLQMLPRRVALDFRDVFSKGFQFDRISASLDVKDGVINTSDFKMRGSAAEVEMKGQADLVSETQNLRVRVVPALGDSASTVVGLVNPVAGVASAIAQRVLKNPLGQIFSYEYDVTGPWSDPKIAKVAPVMPAPQLPGDRAP